MSSLKIAVLESLGIPDDALHALEEPFRAEGHCFTHHERTTDTAVLQQEMRDADAVILANMPLPAETIDSAERLGFIDVAFTGVDHVAMECVHRHGITLSNASGYSNEAVAELGVGMVLSLMRKLPQVEEKCRTGGTKAGLIGCELRGKTVGVVGLGQIGRRTAELMHAFGCRILSSSRSGHADCPAYVTELPLADVLRESDVVMLHCPLNESTRGLIGMNELKLMKPTAMLVNLARGPVVVARELADALNQGVIAAAAVDVFEREPTLDADEPLLHCRNIMVTPHVAFATQESMLLRAQIVFDNLRAWLQGRPQNVVK